MTAPTDIAGAAAALRGGATEARAGGTDVMARAAHRADAGPFTDLGRVAGLRGVTWRADGSALVGATTTVAEVAADARLRAAYPALTATAAALATPQIRATATVGGNLLQRNRCWYFRNPAFRCLQDGGDTCPAHAGDHRYGTVVDPGPCVAPHPSSLAAALLAYDARVAVEGAGPRPVAALYDAADPTRDHVLEPGALLVAVELPVPAAGEAAAYRRATARSRAEWPLVEAVARVVFDGARVASAAVAVGGVARTPLRLPEVEEALTGGPLTAEAVAAAVAGLPDRCAPLPRTGYKAVLLPATVQDVLERLIPA
ncbi:FAD binding domain-containing protein [Nocardiopsis trehalosi]|uniref:FAD binding domain-containing protein n=1 Tax=Nocardiopsis trehalosi TaxID=109329 RepID=UPI00083076B7|nr:FAD binding domain-containing protein [Nocardiopsis trehalosi]